ncbi:MAG: acetylornithine carbamoyltransferase [Myxococcales bacterium]|nr:acetylornithine carbamoyltransferase [Myxococcales bacterium]
MRHLISTADWSRSDLQAILDHAKALKADPIQPLLHQKSVGLLFFNPSMRTRSSFQLGIQQMGGHFVALAPGKDAWPIEFNEREIMDGEPEEHIAEVAKVLSRYCDLLAVRAFPKFQNWEDDRQDKVIQAFAKYATVPVINMETITHPCQEMALALTLQEKWGETDNKNFLLTWTYHPKPLNTAVANSGLLIASKMGMNVKLLIPHEDYRLDERYMNLTQQFCEENGRTFEVTTDIESAYSGANMVYAKSWGALPYFGNWEAEKPMREKSKHFIVDETKMALTDNGFFSHCLPVRRNVKVTDGVLDSEAAIHIDEAENRIHVQKALMAALV